MFTYHVYSCALHIKRVKFYFAPHELIFILLGDIAPVKNVHSISSIISNKIMCLLNIRLGAMYWSLRGYEYCCGGRFLLPMSEPKVEVQLREGHQANP